MRALSSSSPILAVQIPFVILSIPHPILSDEASAAPGKLALACQNLIYCLRLNKNVQKPSKTERFQNTAIFGCFRTFSFKRMQ